MGIKHWSHGHDLKLGHVSEFTELAGGKKGCTDCSRCFETIHGRAFLCKKDDCSFMIDESCFGISKDQELLHPLHPHPLLLTFKLNPLLLRPSICAGCDSLCAGFIFQCEMCDFTLDVHCALSKDQSHRQRNEAHAFQQNNKPTTIQHFLDPHSLRLFYFRGEVICKICLGSIPDPAYGYPECQSGPVTRLAYGCLHCKTCLHISRAEFPKEIQHPYHPQHPFRVSPVTDFEEPNLLSKCKVCRGYLYGKPLYQCLPCRLALHMDCAYKTLFSSPLNHECHNHALYYVIGSDYPEEDIDINVDHQQDKDLGTESSTSTDKEEEDAESDDGQGDDEEDPNEGSDEAEDEEEPDAESYDGEDEHEEESDLPITDDPLCSACNKLCVKSYYQCLECEYFIHLNCIGFPATADHSCHFHPLTLVDSFVEDDSGEYYCHACEQRRKPECPVYHCKECPDDVPFAAHIECVASKEADAPLESGMPVNDEPERYPAFIEFNEEMRKRQCKMQIANNDFNNEHVLTFHERDTTLPPLATCYGCNTSVKGSSYYICDFCGRMFHKFFAKIAQEEFPSIMCRFGPAYDKSTFKCKVCREQCLGSFYRCVECDMNFHHNCLPVPYKVKHHCHIDPLTVTDSMWEDDSGEYICEICTETRNPNHGLYCCKECMVFAHIGCVLEEEDDTLEIVTWNEQSDDTLERESRKELEDEESLVKEFSKSFIEMFAES
ncbi:hypothetical protein Tsubulata_040194 [Turnera subulata]|uniref:Phorbol-ester/DAG-type domain-containing protein n=1 Tax=Turnera subulata TaxID=218843 RepID=A0A9Q0FDT6_9ROSI|nr:hypothetical protein Tsubulata_040194 [Turnera subulata]